MISVQHALELLDNDKSFKEWKKSSADSYLCHSLKMLDDEDAWHIGFSNPDGSITTFIVSDSSIEIDQPQEVFKHPDSKILPLNKQDLAITAEQALTIATDHLTKNYSKDLPSKNIIILQSLDIGQVYNITFITLSMSTINIKICSKTGEILEDKKTNLMDFKVNDV
ncbi:MAG: hypothetical protein ACMXYG_06705 [Candidatus Woesearchaeota archaeon]